VPFKRKEDRSQSGLRKGIPGPCLFWTKRDPCDYRFGGTNNCDSILLPSITLQIGGREVYLTPAHVFVAHGVGGCICGQET
jgi:hypothetical protein